MNPRGTSPAGLQRTSEIAQWIRAMFDRVAPRYDLLNHLLSFQLDRLWRRRAARRLATYVAPGDRVLDACCGTGDLSLAILRTTGAKVIGLDFSWPMLERARQKAEGEQGGAWVQGDALCLPFPDGCFSAVTMAFGFRNLADYAQGLREALRVLRPGGVLAILEFSEPPNCCLRRFYGFYSHRLLPKIGGWISGAREAYQYLPASIARFPRAEELAAQMVSAGFVDVGFERFHGGIVALHTGRAPGS